MLRFIRHTWETQQQLFVSCYQQKLTTANAPVLHRCQPDVSNEKWLWLAEGETPDMTVNVTVNSVRKPHAECKLVCFCGDTQTPILVKVQPPGKSVLIKSRNPWSRNSLRIIVYTMHNFVKMSCDILPMENKAKVIKIYKHFCVFRVKRSFLVKPILNIRLQHVLNLCIRKAWTFVELLLKTLKSCNF